MFRSRAGWTLAWTLAWAAVLPAQTPTPASPPKPEDRVGKTITVSETGRGPEKCTVLQVWKLPDGSPVMQTKHNTTGELITVVEMYQPAKPSEKYRVFRWTADGMPPPGCPVKPGTAVAKKKTDAPTPIATSKLPMGGSNEPVKQVVATSKPEAPKPSMMGTKPEAPKPIMTGSTLQEPKPFMPGSASPEAKPQVATKAEGTKTVVGSKPPMPEEPKTIKLPSGPPQLVTMTKPGTEAPASSPFSRPLPSAPTEPKSTVTQASAPSNTSTMLPSKPEKPQPTMNAASGNAPVQMAKHQPAAPAKPGELLPTPAAVAGPPAPKGPDKGSPVVMAGDIHSPTGKVITVTEPSCQPRACTVLRNYCMQDGTKAMDVKACDNGEIMTIVERHQLAGLLDRFRLFRSHDCPPPCPSNVCSVVKGPETIVSSKPASAPVVERKPVVAEPPPSLAATTMSGPNPALNLPEGPKTADSGWKNFLKKPAELAKTPEVKELKPAMQRPELPPLVKEPSKPVMLPEPKLVQKPKDEIIKVSAPPAEVVKPEVVMVTPRMVEMPAPIEIVRQPKTQDVSVPVPLVPLVTNDPCPTVPPPQPPVKPYNTMQSVSVATMGTQPALDPMCPQCGQKLETGLKQASVAVPVMPTMPGTMMPGTAVAMPADPNLYPPRMAAQAAQAAQAAPGQVSPTLWTKGPSMPVSQSPVVVNSRRIMSEPEAQSMHNTVHLMTVLQSSGVPSQREWAAERLRVADAQIQPYVVDALMTAAKTDGAPLVRAASIQSIAHMRVNTPPVVALMEASKLDPDPRVRDEATQALITLSTPPMVKSGVQTAGYKTGK